MKQPLAPTPATVTLTTEAGVARVLEHPTHNGAIESVRDGATLTVTGPYGSAMVVIPVEVPDMVDRAQLIFEGWGSPAGGVEPIRKRWLVQTSTFAPTWQTAFAVAGALRFRRDHARLGLDLISRMVELDQ